MAGNSTRLDTELRIRANVSGVDEMRQLLERLEELGANTDSLKTALEELAESWDNDNLEASQERLNELAEQAHELADSLGEVGDAAEEASEASEELGESAEETGENLKEMAKNLIEMAASMEVMNSLVEAAGSFESALSEVTKTTGATSEQLETLSKTIQDAAVDFALPAKEIAKIAANGGQAGVALENMTEYIKTVGVMASAFSVSADEMATSVANLQTILNKSLSEIRDLGDAINTLGNTTSAKEADIVNVLKRIGAAGSDLGLTANAIAALGATMLSTGKATEVSGTALNAFFQRLNSGADTVPTFKEGLRAMGYTAESLGASLKEDAADGVIKFLEALNRLESSKRGEVLNNLFGAQFSDDINSLISSLPALKKNMAAVADQTAISGAMQSEFNNLMSGYEVEVARAQAALGNLAITLANQLLPSLTAGSTAFRGVVETVSEFAEANPALTKFLTIIGTAALSTVAFRSALGLLGIQANLTGAGIASSFTAAAGRAQLAFASIKTGLLSLTSTAGLSTAAMGALNGTLNLIKANPIAIAFTAMAAAASFWGGEAENAFKKASDASEEALKSFEKYRDALKSGVPLEVGQTEQALRAVRDALTENKIALEKLHEAGEQASSDYRQLTAEGGRLRQAEEELNAALRKEEALKALDNFNKKQQEAADAARDIDKESRQILTDLQALQGTAAKLTEEQLKAIQSSFKNLSGVDAVAEAQTQLTGLLTKNLITYQQYDGLWRDLQTKHEAFIDRMNSGVDKHGTELKALNEAYAFLALEAPKHLQTITAEEENLGKMLLKMHEQHKIGMEQMGSILEAAMNKVDTEPGRRLVQDFYEKWRKQAQRTGELTAQKSQEFRAILEREIGPAARKAQEEAQRAAEETARAVEKAMESLHRAGEAAVRELGLTFSGLSQSGEKFTKDWVRGMQELELRGALTGDKVRQAFDLNLNALKTKEDFAAFQEALQKTGEATAQLTKQQQELLKAGMQGGAEAVQKLVDAQKKQAEAASKVKDSTTAMTAADRNAVAAKTELSGATEKAATALAKADEATKAAAASTQVYKTQLYDATKLTEQQKNAIHGQYVQALKLQAQLNGSYGVMESASARAADNMIKSAQELTRYNQTVASLNEKINLGTWHVRDLTTSYSSLGDQLDGRVSAAMDKIREKMRAANDEAADTVKNLRAQLAELNGDSTAQMRLDNERKLQELRAKRDTAKARGNNEETKSYEEALQLQERINSKRLAQQLEQQRQRAASSSNLDYEKAARQIGDSIEDNTRRMVAEGERRALTNLTEQLIQDQKRRPQ